MNLVTIAWKSLRQRALSSSLTGLSVALGVTLMVAVLVLSAALDRTFSQTASGYDLIVGPKGSELQLVLNTVFRVSQPVENLPWRYYEELKQDPRIADAIPFALGDTTKEGGFPLVGTTPRFFETEYIPGRKFRLRGEKLDDPFDAVIGARVARKNGWDVGSEFSLVHGGADSSEVHDETFRVAAVLAPTGTPNDKTVFIHLEGFFLISGHEKPLEEAVRREAEFFGEELTDDEVQQRVGEIRERMGHEESSEEHGNDEDGGEHHDEEHHDPAGIPDVQKEVTAVLVNIRGGSQAQKSWPMIRFQSELQEGFKAQAVNPVQQINWLMNNVVGNVRSMLYVLTVLIIVVSGVSIFVSIYNSMAERKREIAVMRALGAQRGTVFAIVLAESILLCLGGGVLGMLLGHGLAFAAAPVVEARSGLLIDPFAFDVRELILLPTLILLASLVGFIPALTAYRADVAESLGG